MQNNLRVNDTVFQFLSIVSGIVCGVLGYTDLRGFVAFLAFNALIGCAVLAKCDFDHAPYFLGRDKIFVGGAAPARAPSSSSGPSSTTSVSLLKEHGRSENDPRSKRSP